MTYEPLVKDVIEVGKAIHMCADKLLSMPLPEPTDPLFCEYLSEWLKLYVSLRTLEVQAVATREDGSFAVDVFEVGMQGIADELMKAIATEDPTGSIRYEIKLKHADAVADKVLENSKTEHGPEYA